MESIQQVGGEENGFTDRFKDKSPIFQALRGSELLNQLEIWTWKDENFYLLTTPLSYFSGRVKCFKKKYYPTEKQKETTVGKENVILDLGALLSMIR